MYSERPRLLLTLQPMDKWLEILALNGLIVLWIFCIRSYTILPEIIPTHFSGSGVVDGHGSKATLFILPVIATVIFLLLSVLNKYPYVFNYIVLITSDNAERQYRLATRMLRQLKLIIILLFGGISFAIIASVNDGSIARWVGLFVPIISLLLIMPTIFYIVKSAKSKTRVN